MYIKLASIIEIVIGLVMGGIGGFMFLAFAGSPAFDIAFPAFIFGISIILLSIFLIIFGINLWQLKRWAWSASILILIIVIAFSIMKIGLFGPLLVSSRVSAIICFILLIWGREQIFPVRETTESLPKIQMKKKISIPWKKILIVVALIIAGAIGYLGYHWYKTSQLPVPVIPVIRDETVNWKIYRNVYFYESDYWGYEIKYPPDWIITEYKGVHQAKWTSPRTVPLPLREIFIETSGAFRHGGVYIDTVNCTWSESQKEWFKKYPETESKTYPFPIGKEKIGKMEFCRMEDIGGDEIGKIGGLGIKYVIYKNGWDYENTLWVYYDISEDYQPSEDEFRYELDIFKKILSTFKFKEK